MLDLIASSMFAWLNTWQKPENKLQPLELFPWHDTAIFELPPQKQDSIAENIVQTYLQDLSKRGINSDRQGIWIQSGWHSFANERGKTPLPAASLTKTATTLAALGKWGAEHQFATKIHVTEAIEDGIVRGDLIIEGDGDPLFVWEEAIALGNTLNQLGIREIEGNLLVTDKFYMNYQDRPQSAGKLLKQSFDKTLWQSEITRQYLQMPVGTPQPRIAIAGQVKLVPDLPATAKLLVTHQSLPLAEILRQMNIYSNNKMAQMLADLLGGAEEVARASADLAYFPRNEIELINGSGLGEENRLSPRAVCQILIAIDRLLQNFSLTAIDLFPTAGRDLVGTVKDRGLPTGTAVKTGTLDRVSALAGVIPTSDRPSPIASQSDNVYFSIINYGRQYEYFRQQQDRLLNELVRGWQLVPDDFSLATEQDWFLGDPKRNLVYSDPI